jgi:yeast amino acid transporter
MPYVAFGFCTVFALLAYMTLGSSSGIVFTWLSNFTATSGLVTWFGIGVTYLRFYKGMKVQGFDRRTLPYFTRVQPFAAWWCVCGSAFVLIVRVRFTRGYHVD